MDAITDRLRALTEGLDTRYIDPVSVTPIGGNTGLSSHLAPRDAPSTGCLRSSL